MNGEILLDTNIVIALFANDEAVLTRIGEVAEVRVSSVVIGELYYGARKSGRVAANVARVEEFASQSAILDCDVETAGYYALIKNELKLMGKPIPENDIWIAAVALQHDLILVTRDAHFREVRDLKTDIW